MSKRATLCIICDKRPQLDDSAYCADCLRNEPGIVAAYDADSDLKLELMHDAASARRARRQDVEHLDDPTPGELQKRGAFDVGEWVESLTGALGIEWQPGTREHYTEKLSRFVEKGNRILAMNIGQQCIEAVFALAVKTAADYLTEYIDNPNLEDDVWIAIQFNRWRAAMGEHKPIRKSTFKNKAKEGKWILRTVDKTGELPSKHRPRKQS